jgi:hypothetical protein
VPTTSTDGGPSPIHCDGGDRTVGDTAGAGSPVAVPVLPCRRRGNPCGTRSIAEAGAWRIRRRHRNLRVRQIDTAGMLAGMDKPDGGSVRIAGRRISHRPEPQRTRSGPATSACSFRTPTCSRDSGSSKALSVLSVGRYHSGAIDVWPPQPNQIAGRRVTLRPARKLSLTGPAGRKTGAALGRAVAGSLFFRHRLCCRFESTAMGPQNPASVGRPSAALFRHGTRRREPVVTRCDLTD